jgi:hypothetical protein
VLVESIVSGRFTEAEVVGLAYGYRPNMPTQAKVKYKILKGFLFKYAIEKTRWVDFCWLTLINDNK